jgi:hypothetical protein
MNSVLLIVGKGHAGIIPLQDRKNLVGKNPPEKISLLFRKMSKKLMIYDQKVK